VALIIGSALTRGEDYGEKKDTLELLLVNVELIAPSMLAPQLFLQA